MEQQQMSYWLERLDKDSRNLDEQRKIGLITAMLVNHCQLSEAELAVFLDKEFVPSFSNLPQTILYSKAESKIAEFYNAPFPELGTPEYVTLSTHHEAFVTDFKDILTDIYTESEINELLSFGTLRDDDFLNRKLVGKDFYAYRRIRNAYIPGMTDSFVLEVDENGAILSSQDTTHTLFDGPDDAVTQLEKALGLNPHTKS